MARRDKNTEPERVVFAVRSVVPAKDVKTIRPPRMPNIKCCGGGK